MLISHKLKIIYIKSRKVAGTSFRKALMKYCKKTDCIYPGAVQTGEVILKDGYNRDSIYTHVPAAKLKESIPKDIWDNYLKIVTIRCPYDVYISSYYYRCSIGFLVNVSFMQFVDDFPIFIEDLHHLHNREGKILVDFIIRFEHLEEDISHLEKKIDCPGLLETFQSIDKKKNIRPPKTNPYIIYSKYPNAKLVIDERCQKYHDEGDEFFKKYWPVYKTKLEENISKYKEKGDLNKRNITENITTSKE